jgi:hypothetical protein
MQYNPLTKTLWDDDGNLLKKVHCPKAVSRDQISGGRCRLCDHEVVPLDVLSEREALLLLRSKPDLCVSFRIDAPLIRIIPHDPS